MANHHIEVELNNKTGQFRVIAWADPERTGILHIAECYSLHLCMENLRENGIETVGYVVEPEPTQERLEYWNLTEDEFHGQPEVLRFVYLLAPIHKNGDVIVPGSEHEHVYGDELLIDAVCEGMDITFEQFRSLSLGEQHSRQAGWVS